MASDISSNCADAIEMLDEKEEGEISLEDVSSSEEGHPCPHCLSTKRCASWCTFVTRSNYLKSYGRRDAVHEKENHRLSKESGYLGIKHTSFTLQEKNDDLVPISSDSDMELVGLSDHPKQVYASSKTPKRKKKKKKRIHRGEEIVLRDEDLASPASPINDDIVEIVEAASSNVAVSKEEQQSRTRYREHDLIHRSSCCSGVCRSRAAISPCRRRKSPVKLRIKQKKSRSPVLRSRSPMIEKSVKKIRSPARLAYRSPSTRSACRTTKTRDSSYGRTYTYKLLKKVKRLDNSVIQQNVENSKNNKENGSSLKEKLNNIIKKSSATKGSTRDKENHVETKNKRNHENDDEEDLARLRQIALETKMKNARKSNEGSQKELVQKDSVAEMNGETEDNGDNDDEEDLKLRVIALRSAFLRKHRERKQRGLISKSTKVRSESPFGDSFLENLSILKEENDDGNLSHIEPHVPQESTNPEDMDLDTDIEREKEKEESPYSPTDEIDDRLSIERELLGIDPTDVSFISYSDDRSSSHCDYISAKETLSISPAKSGSYTGHTSGNESCCPSESVASPKNYEYLPPLSPQICELQVNTIGTTNKNVEATIHNHQIFNSQIHPTSEMVNISNNKFITANVLQNSEVQNTVFQGGNNNIINATFPVLYESDENASSLFNNNMHHLPLSPPPAPPNVCIVANLMCTSVADELAETDLDGSPLVVIDEEPQNANIVISEKSMWSTVANNLLPNPGNSLTPETISKSNINLIQFSPIKAFDVHGQFHNHVEEHAFKTAEMQPVNVSYDGARSSMPFKPIKIASIPKKQIPVTNPMVIFSDASDDSLTDANSPGTQNICTENQVKEISTKDAGNEIHKKVLTEDSNDSNLMDKKKKKKNKTLKTNKDECKDSTGKRKMKTEKENVNATKTNQSAELQNKIVKLSENRHFCEQEKEERFRNTDKENNEKKVENVNVTLEKKVEDDVKVNNLIQKSINSMPINNTKDKCHQPVATKPIASEIQRRVSVDEDEETLREMLLASLGKRIKPSESVQATQTKQTIVTKPSESNINATTIEIKKPTVPAIIESTKINSNAIIETTNKLEEKSEISLVKKITNNASMLFKLNVASKENTNQLKNATVKVTGVEATRKRPNLADTDENSAKKIKRSIYPASVAAVNNTKRFQNSLEQKKLNVQKMSVTFSTQKSSNTSSLRKVNIKEKSGPTSPSRSSLLPENQRFIISLHSDTESDSESEKQQSSNAAVTVSQGGVERRRQTLNIPTTEFERSVDQFLREVRKKQESAANKSTQAIMIQPASTLVKKTPVKKPVNSTSGALPATPLAVRHLPASQQEEYRRLKQQILEREKLKLQKTKTKCVQVSSDSNINTPVPSLTGTNVNRFQKPSEKLTPQSTVISITTATTLNSDTKVKCVTQSTKPLTTSDSDATKTVGKSTKIMNKTDIKSKKTIDKVTGTVVASDTHATKTVNKPANTGIVGKIDVKKIVDKPVTVTTAVETNAKKTVDEFTETKTATDHVDKSLKKVAVDKTNIEKTINKSVTHELSSFTTISESDEIVNKVNLMAKSIVSSKPVTSTDKKSIIPDTIPAKSPGSFDDENISNVTSSNFESSSQKTEKKSTLKILTMEEVNSKFAKTQNSFVNSIKQTITTDINQQKDDVANVDLVVSENLPKDDSIIMISEENSNISKIIVFGQDKNCEDERDSQNIMIDISTCGGNSQKQGRSSSKRPDECTNNQRQFDARTSADRLVAGNNGIEIHLELQIMAKLTPAEQKQHLISTENKLITKRYKVVAALTEMATALKQWEKERAIQTQLANEVRTLREQLRLAEEKLLEQKKHISDMSPSVTASHEKIDNGRKECNKLSRLCTGLGQQIYGSNYNEKEKLQIQPHSRIPASGARLLSKKLKEVAAHTTKLKNMPTISPTENITVYNKENSNVINPYASANAIKKASAIKETEVIVISDNIPTKKKNAPQNTDKEKKTSASVDKCRNVDTQKPNEGPQKSVPQASGTSKEQNSDDTIFVERQSAESVNNNVEEAGTSLLMENIVESGKSSSKKSVKPYESILSHLKTSRSMKFNGILCPYELRGTCSDNDCQFLHHSSNHCQ